MWCILPHVSQALLLSISFSTCCIIFVSFVCAFIYYFIFSLIVDRHSDKTQKCSLHISWNATKLFQYHHGGRQDHLWSYLNSYFVKPETWKDRVRWSWRLLWCMQNFKMGADKRLSYNRCHLLLILVLITWIHNLHAHNISSLSIIISLQHSNETYKHIKSCQHYKEVSAHLKHF